MKSKTLPVKQTNKSCPFIIFLLSDFQLNLFHLHKTWVKILKLYIGISVNSLVFLLFFASIFKRQNVKPCNFFSPPLISYILGNVSVGNLPYFLPFVLQEIKNQPKRQYLLLHSLKEVSPITRRLQKCDSAIKLLLCLFYKKSLFQEKKKKLNFAFDAFFLHLTNCFNEWGAEKLLAWLIGQNLLKMNSDCILVLGTKL